MKDSPAETAREERADSQKLRTEIKVERERVSLDLGSDEVKTFF